MLPSRFFISTPLDRKPIQSPNLCKSPHRLMACCGLSHTTGLMPYRLCSPITTPTHASMSHLVQTILPSRNTLVPKETPRAGLWAIGISTLMCWYHLFITHHFSCHIACSLFISSFISLCFIYLLQTYMVRFSTSFSIKSKPTPPKLLPRPKI